MRLRRLVDFFESRWLHRATARHATTIKLISSRDRDTIVFRFHGDASGPRSVSVRSFLEQFVRAELRIDRT